MTTRGSVGKVALFDCAYQTGLINAQMLILRSDCTTIEQKYLFYSFCSADMQSKIRNFSSGSAQPQIPIQDLREIEIDYPPLPTQRRIASILSAYDDLIENNTRRIKILEQMAQAIYREWFVEFRAPGVKLRKATPEEQKVTGKDRFPVGWEIEAVGDIAQNRMSKPARSEYT